MKKIWIKQIWEFGLGNMVMMTPGLRELSMRLGHRIPIYFQTDGLGQLFADCPFIDTLASPLNYRASYTSRKPERLSGESDYEAWARILNNCGRESLLDPYVDKCSPPEWWKRPEGKAVAIVHGCLSNYPPSIASKDVGVEVRQHMIDAVTGAGATPVVIGNESDALRFWNGCDIYRNDVDTSALGVMQSLRQAVGIMQACDAFIANDTGLYHAGAASGMAGLVLWQDTEFEKNRAPSDRVRHSRSPEDHEQQISEFLKAVL